MGVMAKIFALFGLAASSGYLGDIFEGFAAGLRWLGFRTARVLGVGVGGRAGRPARGAGVREGLEGCEV